MALTPEERAQLEAQLAAKQKELIGLQNGDISIKSMEMSQEPLTSWEKAHPPPQIPIGTPPPPPSAAPVAPVPSGPGETAGMRESPATEDPRRSEESVSPETVARVKEQQRIARLDDWTQMPEFQTASGANFMASLGTAFATDPARIEKIVKYNFPGVKVKTVGDSMIFTSHANGQEYGYSPGLNMQDVKRLGKGVGATVALGAALPAVLPAAVTAALPAAGTVGAAALAGAGGGLMSEFNQWLAGGGFEPGNVVQDTALGVATHGALQGAKTAWHARPGAPVPVLPAAATPAPPARVNAAPAAGAALTPEKAMMQGARGSETAQRQAAQLLEPHPDVVRAADELGIPTGAGGDLAPAIMARGETEAQKRAIALDQGFASNKASLSRITQDEGLARAAVKARNALEEVGVESTGTISQKASTALATAHKELEDHAEALYRNLIPLETPISGAEVLEYVADWQKKHANARLPPELAELVDSLTPKPVRDVRGRIVSQGRPSWGTLDDLTKRAGAATRGPKTFKDFERGAAKDLYGALTTARDNVAKTLGKDTELDAAKAAVRIRKEFEKNIETLLGKQIEETLGVDLFPHVVPAIRGALRGDMQKFTALTAALKKLPEGLSQDIMASALVNMFEKAEKNQPLNWENIAQFFSRMRSQQTAQGAIMFSLAPKARQRFLHLEKIAKNIQKAVAYRQQTGTSSMNATQRLLKADTITNQLIDMAARKVPYAGTVAGMGTGGLTGGGPTGIGLGAVLGGAAGSLAKRALNEMSTPAEQALDEFLSSPAFYDMVRTGVGSVPVAPNLVRKLAATPTVRKLAHAWNMPIPRLAQELARVARPVEGMAARRALPLEKPEEENR